MKQSRTTSSQAGNSILHLLLAVVVIGVVGLAGWAVYRHRHNNQVHSNTGSTASSIATPSSATSLSPGTDNQSLQADLSNVNGSLSTENQGASGANSALSDQQYQVAVPTN